MYSLKEIDSNAFSIMGYVRKAMIKEKFSNEEIDEYIQECKSSDYENLLFVSLINIDKCNERSKE